MHYEKCKHCGAELMVGELCNCEKAKEERSMVKEAMMVSLKYLDEMEKIDGGDDRNADILNEAFKTVLEEMSEKYNQDPKEFMAKVIDTIEEFLDE